MERPHAFHTSRGSLATATLLTGKFASKSNNSHFVSGALVTPGKKMHHHEFYEWKRASVWQTVASPCGGVSKEMERVSECVVRGRRGKTNSMWYKRNRDRANRAATDATAPLFPLAYSSGHNMASQVVRGCFLPHAHVFPVIDHSTQLLSVKRRICYFTFRS